MHNPDFNISEIQVIEFPAIGSPALGFITVAEQKVNVPFEIKRVFWTYLTPNEIQRGGHAHKELEQVVFAVTGVIEFTTIDRSLNRETYILENPSWGLYLPKLTWGDIKFSNTSILLCLASELYNADDYIRDFNEFEKFVQ